VKRKGEKEKTPKLWGGVLSLKEKDGERGGRLQVLYPVTEDAKRGGEK